MLHVHRFPLLQQCFQQHLTAEKVHSSPVWMALTTNKGQTHSATANHPHFRTTVVFQSDIKAISALCSLLHHQTARKVLCFLQEWEEAVKQHFSTAIGSAEPQLSASVAATSTDPCSCQCSLNTVFHQEISSRSRR